MIYVLVWFELLRQSAFLSTSSLICHIWGATALGWASGSKRGYYENSKYDDKDDDDDGGGVPCDPWVRVADRDNLALCTTWPGTQHHHENMSRIAPLSVGFMIRIISTDEHIFEYSLGQIATHATSSYREQDSTVVRGFVLKYKIVYQPATQAI